MSPSQYFCESHRFGSLHAHLCEFGTPLLRSLHSGKVLSSIMTVRQQALGPRSKNAVVAGLALIEICRGLDLLDSLLAVKRGFRIVPQFAVTSQLVEVHLWVITGIREASIGVGDSSIRLLGRWNSQSFLSVWVNGAHVLAFPIASCSSSESLLMYSGNGLASWSAILTMAALPTFFAFTCIIVCRNSPRSRNRSLAVAKRSRYGSASFRPVNSPPTNRSLISLSVSGHCFFLTAVSICVRRSRRLHANCATSRIDPSGSFVKSRPGSSPAFTRAS